jgi:hypothetical protein
MMCSRNSANERGEKCLRGPVGDDTVPREDLGSELEVCLGCGHLPGVAEAQHRPQALLGQGRADLTDRRPDHRRWYVVEGVLTPRSRCPVDGVLQPARDRAVVLGRDKQDGLRPVDRLLERDGLGWIVLVVVLTVERQVPDRDLGELELGGREAD